MLKTAILNSKLAINQEIKKTLFERPSQVGTVKLNMAKDICKALNGNFEIF